MPLLEGADPDRLELAARQLTVASLRLEGASRQLGGLLAQARVNRSPAMAYTVASTIMPTLANHVVAAKSAVKQLTERAHQQRLQSSGSQDTRGSGGSQTSKPQFSDEVLELLDRVKDDKRWLADTAERMRRAKDGKFWFTKTYAHVTEELVKSVEEGRYENPKAVLLEEIGFTQVYRQNLAAWESGDKYAVYPNWAVAFARVEAINKGNWSQFESHERASMVIPSALAHIKWDLPDVLADVARRTYGNNISAENLAVMRRDFFKMGEIFNVAEQAMRKEITAGTYRFDPGRVEVLQDLGKGVFLPTDQVRRQAFHTAEQLIRAHQAGITDPEAIAKFLYDKNALPAEISGRVIRNYPWR